jgi:choline dehydrogenase-like flavoprotein
LLNPVHSFDYIIVGSGPTGSAVAYRLAKANANRKVLLIEAGDDPDPLSIVSL